MLDSIPKIDLLDCPIHSITMNDTLAIIDRSIKAKLQIHHVVVNAAKLVHMKNNASLKESVVSCDIINADGQSLVWAAKILGMHLPERVAGIDLMQRLIELAHEKYYKIFFLGADNEVLEKVVSLYRERYGDRIIAGSRDGYFSEADEQFVAEQIANSKADILFVAMSSPKKEIFLNKYKNLINTSFIMGVGGSFDVIAGKVKRAPRWMQTSGLEWLYRVIQEPGRMWKRYLTTNTLFILAVIRAKIFKR